MEKRIPETEGEVQRILKIIMGHLRSRRNPSYLLDPRPALVMEYLYRVNKGLGVMWGEVELDDTMQCPYVDCDRVLQVSVDTGWFMCDYCKRLFHLTWNHGCDVKMPEDGMPMPEDVRTARDLGPFWGDPMEQRIIPSF